MTDIEILDKLVPYKDKYSWEDYPIVIDGLGTPYVCLVVAESPANMRPAIKWFVFGVVSELTTIEADNDAVVFGYKETELKTTSRMATFSLRNIRDLDATFHVGPDAVRHKCPPRGWQLVGRGEQYGNILRRIDGKTEHVSSGSHPANAGSGKGV